jgi:predicted DNA-binding protein
MVRVATTKVTFTLDEPTSARLQQAAERLALSKSEVVREAIQEFFERMGRLSEGERVKMLRTFDEMVPQIPARDISETQQEQRDIRLARRNGGRRGL